MLDLICKIYASVTRTFFFLTSPLCGLNSKGISYKKTSFDLIVAGKVTAGINRHEEEQPDR